MDNIIRQSVSLSFARFPSTIVKLRFPFSRVYKYLSYRDLFLKRRHLKSFFVFAAGVCQTSNDARTNEAKEIRKKKTLLVLAARECVFSWKVGVGVVVPIVGVKLNLGEEKERSIVRSASKTRSSSSSTVGRSVVRSLFRPFALTSRYMSV